MAAKYQSRDSFFAHWFVRVLHKSCAAQEIGPVACYLLCVIAHTEDAARYSGPVMFWNTQLMETMGFKSKKQLIAARDKAVDAGWLSYERDGTRAVGQYFVRIPERYRSINGAAIEASIGSENGTNSSLNQPAISSQFGTNPPAIGGENGTNQHDIPSDSFRFRNQFGTESGSPPNPSPSPLNTSCTEPPQAASVPTSPAQAVPLKMKLSAPEVEAVEFPNFPCVPAKAGEGYRIWTLTEDHLAELSALYQSVNVDHEARRALRWCKDHPRKIKTPDGMPRFLSNWMKGEQNKGGSRGASTSSAKTPREITRPAKRHSSYQETLS